MATKTRATTLGDYICKVGFYDIRQKTTERKAGRGNKTEVASSELVICHGRNIIERGFKSKEKVVARAKELLGGKFQKVYNIK
jgi:hypothetical protein